MITLLHFTNFLFVKLNFTHCIPLQKISNALPSVKQWWLAKRKIWTNNGWIFTASISNKSSQVDMLCLPTNKSY